ncbi:Sortase family protein [Planococcus massiliensis]|uniref:Sortase family protein n=1 Tax=Planococcus massiliensis TaxID=1499687 RepID=A0A098EIC6_9BACL|nr:class F sortase [Planococcus massiliensis]CEG21555.1 Sortase family protein [Planococcus massiliensis]
MKQIVTMGIAVFLVAALFFILKPLANGPADKEESVQLEENSEKEVTAGNVVDKIAEFPIFPEQREKLEMVQKQRQESIKGMEPASIEIGSIGVKAAIEPTGILENGEMGVPEDVDQVGWFEPGFKAGAKGHAVLAGHVDSLTGPAVFYELKKVEPGDQVKLADAKGREMVFEVQKLASYETDAAPIEEIFGNADGRFINLITCTGDFNRDIGSHEERLVVTAELISDSAVEIAAPKAPENVIATGFNISWHAIRDDAIIGYRVYEEDTATGEMKKIETVSLFDRKNITIEQSEGKRYYVASVDVDLKESKKAEALK